MQDPPPQVPPDPPDPPSLAPLAPPAPPLARSLPRSLPQEALIQYVITAGADGQLPVRLATLTNRDVLHVISAVLKTHSLHLGDRIPKEIKCLIYEGICHCFPSLRMAATSVRTFFNWATCRNRDCFRRDRKTGIISERPSLDDVFIPKKKGGKRKAKKQKPAKHHVFSTIQISAASIKLKLQRSIIPIMNSFNGRYVVELFKRQYADKCRLSSGLASLNHYVLESVLDYLPIYAGQIMKHTRESLTIGSIDFGAVKAVADHPELCDQAVWAMDMGTSFYISRKDAMAMYDQLAEVGPDMKDPFEIWRRLLFIIDVGEDDCDIMDIDV